MSNNNVDENNNNNYNIDSANSKNLSNKSSIVMEMVEAVIDNNYDVNSHNSMSVNELNEAKLSTTRGDDENSLETTTSVRESVKAQLPRKRTKSKFSRRRKVQSKGKLKTIESF